MEKRQENVDANLRELKEYYASLGYNHNEINKLIKRCAMRDIVLIQIRIEDYQELLHVDRARVLKLILKYHHLLGYETKGKHIPTSVESKILDWQNTFHLDEQTVIKMILGTPRMLDAGKLQDVLANYQRVLQTDQATVKKIILKRTDLAALNIDKNITPTLTFYRDTLQIDQSTLTQMILQYPAMLTLDIKAGPLSVKSKIEKLNEVVPFTELRARLIKNPMILSAPAQNIKLRYMLAVLADDYTGPDYDVINVFFKRGSVTGQDTVYARLRYMMQHGIKTMSHLYEGKNSFNRTFGVKTEDLKQQYPLDAQALNQIEQEFLRITHRWFELNPQELGKMNMTRNPAGAVIPDDTRSL